MAKSSARVTGLKTLSKRLSRLARELPAEVQQGVDDTAAATLRGMAGAINAGIDDSSDWIRVKPNSASSSIVASKPKKHGKGNAEAEIRVADDQSSVLKFSLGGEMVRRPGDVGVGRSMIWVGQEKALAEHQGIRMTPEGGLPRGTLRKLSGRAKRKGKRIAGSETDIFFGQPKGRRRVVGFWQRPENKRHSLKLLVAAVKEVHYDGNRLVPFWNKGIEAGTDKAPRRMEKSVIDAVRASVRGVR